MTTAEVIAKAKEIMQKIIANKVLLYVFIGLVALCLWYFFFSGSGKSIAFKLLRDQIAAQDAAMRATYEDQIKRLDKELTAKAAELKKSSERVQELENKIKAYEIKRGNIKPAKSAADLQARFKERGYNVEIR